MVEELASGDWEELRAQGLNPTLEDFDRLNQIALRLKAGDETTSANFPRVGWAGDVPFFEPTVQAFAWYHGYAARCAANPETENTFWAFALAHARDRGAFAALRTPEAIEKAVKEWAETVPATRAEIIRACRYAARGFDDAEPARPDDAETGPKYRSNRSVAAENLARVEDQIVAACVALKCAPDDIMCETQTRLARICEAAAVELGRTVSRDEARLRAEYDLTKREIVRRLKKEKEAADHGEQ